MKRHATDLRVMTYRRDQRRAGGGVPDPRGSVLAGGGQHPPVRAIGDVKDLAVVLEGGAAGWPVATSQIRAVPSAEAVARRDPSGLKTTQMTVSFMDQAGAVHGDAGLGVPDPCRAVEAAGREQAAVAAERDAERRHAGGASPA